MALPGRQFNSANYRYGFNGKENDNEVKGTGNQQDYGMRIYDPRLGKFLSVDPLSNKYPYLSPYAFAENDVIRSIDIDGLEKSYRYISQNDDGSYNIIKTVYHKDLFPGHDHGPQGTGSLDYYYNEKVKKFGVGQYVQSYADEHPVRNWAQTLDRRYEGEAGFKNLGTDLSSGSTYVKAAGVVVVVGGVATGQPEIVAGGIGLYDVGSGMDDVATGVNIISNLNEGKGKEALIDIAGAVAGKTVDKAIDGAKGASDVKKFVGKVAGAEAVDATKEKAKGEKSDGEKK